MMLYQHGSNQNERCYNVRRDHHHHHRHHSRPTPSSRITLPACYLPSTFYLSTTLYIYFLSSLSVSSKRENKFSQLPNQLTFEFLYRFVNSVTDWLINISFTITWAISRNLGVWVSLRTWQTLYGFYWTKVATLVSPGRMSLGEIIGHPWYHTVEICNIPNKCRLAWVTSRHQISIVMASYAWRRFYVTKMLKWHLACLWIPYD